MLIFLEFIMIPRSKKAGNLKQRYFLIMGDMQNCLNIYPCIINNLFTCC